MVLAVKVGNGRLVFRLRRAGGIDPNPRNFETRCAAFAADIGRSGPMTLVAVRRDDGLAAFAVVPPSGQGSVLHLAHAVAARLEATAPGEPELAGRVVGWLAARAGMPPTRETQQGADPAEVSRLLANILPRRCWLAATLRSPTRAEVRRTRRWLAHRTATPNPVHHSMRTEAVVVSVTAGGNTAAEVAQVLSQVSAALPGFDIATRARCSSARGVVVRAACLAAALSTAGATLAADAGRLATAAAVARRGGLQFDAGPVAAWAAAIGWMAMVVGMFVALVGLLRARGLLGSWPGRLLSAQTTLRFPAARRRLRAPRPPVPSRHDDGRRVDGFDGDYPLHVSAFLTGPEVVAGIVAPHAGAVSGEQSAQPRQVPPPLLQPAGPRLGTANGDAVHLSALDLALGVGITGSPGTGKTKLVEALWAWSVLDRRSPSRRPGHPGASNTLIAFDSKGDEVDSYRAWARTAGEKLTVVDVADPHTPAIDLFDTPGDPVQRAGSFVNAMVYGFDPGAIQGRSFEVLHAVFTAALAFPPDTLSELDGLPAPITPTLTAHALCGGFGDQLAVAVFTELNAHSVDAATDRPGDPDAAAMLAAVHRLRPFFHRVSESARRTATEAARNKTGALLDLHAWWPPERPRISWETILAGRESVLVNVGVSTAGVIVDERSGRILSSMLMFGLRQAVQRVGAGWARQGRWVSVFSDELALQAGSSADVLTWLRDQGRAFGVRLVLATQRDGQLPERLRTAFLTMPTLISFKQDEMGAAEEVARQLSSRPGDVTAEDVLNLRPHAALVRTAVDGQRMSPFVCDIDNFEADRAEAAHIWGYPILQPPPVVPAPQPPDTGSDYPDGLLVR